MIVELFISKDRVPYIVETLGADKVTVTKQDGDQDMISFELSSTIDLLHMFHAGVKCGSETMAKALINR
jgi:hypothetical protein